MSYGIPDNLAAGTNRPFDATTRRLAIGLPRRCSQTSGLALLQTTSGDRASFGGGKKAEVGQKTQTAEWVRFCSPGCCSCCRFKLPLPRNQLTAGFAFAAVRVVTYHFQQRDTNRCLPPPLPGQSPKIGNHAFTSRLIIRTGKCRSTTEMKATIGHPGGDGNRGCRRVPLDRSVESFLITLIRRSVSAQHGRLLLR
jgi:hypothetical protein